MSYILGENINIGVGSEVSRGTPVAPTIWIPGRTPTGISVVVDKTLLKETRGSRSSSQGSIITQARAEGDLEFNVRSKSFGYFLYSLFGAADSAAVGGQAGVFDHEFTVLPHNPQHPTISLALSQPDLQDYEYALGLVTSLEIRTPVNDLVNATINLIAKSEAEHAAYTVSWPSADDYFRNYEVTIKIADTVADLATADAIGVKEFSLSVNNNGRPNINIGDYNPSDNLALIFDIGGNLVLDTQDTDYHDKYTAGDYFAMEVKMVRSDITIGASTNPSVAFTLDKVSFENYDADRPMDDIVKEKMAFIAHWDETNESAIKAVIRNTISGYEPGDS